MQNKDKWFKKKIMKQKKSYYFRSKLKKSGKVAKYKIRNYNMYNDDDINFDDYETSFMMILKNMPVEDLHDYSLLRKKIKEKLRESERSRMLI